MADTKISALAAITALDDEDELVVARAGTTKKIDALYLPGFEIAYVEFTSAVTINATSEASPNDVVTSGALSYDGARIQIEFYSPRVDCGTTLNSTIVVMLWDGSTDLGRIAVINNPVATNALFLPVHASRFLTPTVASHTYRIRASRINANGSILAGSGGASAQMPGFIRITKA